MQKVTRCWWPGDDPQYQHYHDAEWGVPIRDDQLFYEKLVLEGAQAGLSWITILRKREAYRKAFADFDIHTVASYGEHQVANLLQNAAIVRNKLKIRSAINNARAMLRFQQESGSFSDYLWSHVNHQQQHNSWSDKSEVPAQTELSQRISKDLKRRGFTFVGPTIIYSLMQATGLVNDHCTDCFRHQQIRQGKFLP